jgi:hypothetical protein
MSRKRAITPIHEVLLRDAPIEFNKKPSVPVRIGRFLMSQFSLRNIFLALMALFLIAIALAVWGLSYTGSTLSINFLMAKLRSSASNSVAQSLQNLFTSAETMTQQIGEYVWADKNELRGNLTQTEKDNVAHFMYSLLKPSYQVRILQVEK